MKRFSKTLGLLVVSLLLLVSGVDAALDGTSLQPAQASFTLYNLRGQTILSFDGSLESCFVHRQHGAPRALRSHDIFAPRA